MASSNIDLIDFDTVLKNPELIKKQLEFIENLPANNRDELTDLHLDKLKEIDQLFNQKSSFFLISKIENIANSYQWKKTLEKTRNISSICSSTSSSELCLDKINDLREFIISQELITERKEHFLTALENIEASYIEFYQSESSYRTIFNNSLSLITNKLTDNYTHKKSLPIEPQKETTHFLNAKELINTRSFKLGCLLLFLVAFFMILKKTLVNKSIRYLKDKQEAKDNLRYLEKFKFKKNETHKKLMPITTEIKQLNYLIKSFNKSIKIKVQELDNEVRFKFEIKSNESIFLKLEDENFLTIKNFLIMLPTKLNNNSDLSISDIFDEQGNIKNILISLTLKLSHVPLTNTKD